MYKINVATCVNHYFKYYRHLWISKVFKFKFPSIALISLKKAIKKESKLIDLISDAQSFLKVIFRNR